MPQMIEDAYATQLTAMLGQLDAACAALDDLTEASEGLFPHSPGPVQHHQHARGGRDHRSRVMAELGDDRTRFDTASSLKALRRRPDHPGIRQEPFSAGAPG